MREALCKAFCDGLLVRKVPAGLAVSTGFLGADGDKIGFYVVESEHASFKRVEENGTTLALLEASGVDFRSDTRREALNSLLDEHSVTFDEQERSFFIDDLREEEVPGAALRFVSFSLRIQEARCVDGRERLYSPGTRESRSRLLVGRCATDTLTTT